MNGEQIKKGKKTTRKPGSRYGRLRKNDPDTADVITKRAPKAKTVRTEKAVAIKKASPIKLKRKPKVQIDKLVLNEDEKLDLTREVYILTKFRHKRITADSKLLEDDEREFIENYISMATDADRDAYYKSRVELKAKQS